MPLDPGQKAPDVSGLNQHGERVSPDFNDLTAVYFYVEDDTPGCTTQAQQFMAEADVYDEAGVRVIGVSTDDVDAHREFADAHDITYDLLADPTGEICEAFDVEIDRRDRATRTTFVIQNGEIIRTYESVRPDGHARNLLIELYDAGIVNLDF